MASPLTLALCALTAVLAIAAAVPVQPQDEPISHSVEKRNVRRLLHKIKHPHIHINVEKLKKCAQERLPGVPNAVQQLIERCASSAAGGMASVSACVGKAAVGPAARASSHLAVCMG